VSNEGLFQFVIRFIRYLVIFSTFVSSEVAIRRTLARQLNEIANNLQQKPGFKDFLSDYIFPAYLKLATDSDGEVIRSAKVNFC